jgi:DNA-binding MarR family transcriptional regulator
VIDETQVQARPAAQPATRDDLGFLLAKATQRWNEILADEFARAGYAEVRPAYGSVLLPLFEEDGLRMSELARRSRLSKQTMTQLVRRLERDGLVRRIDDPDDGRAATVHLTERGRTFHAVADATLARLDARVRHRLSDSAMTELKRALRSLVDLDARPGHPSARSRL